MKAAIIRRGALGSTALLLSLASAPAFAQAVPATPDQSVTAPSTQPAPTTTAPQSTDYTGADIIVTATKQSTTVQKVPASISVVGSAQLDRSGATDLNAITHLTTGVTLGQHAGTTFVQIRGIGNVIDTGAGESSNAIYIDGVFLARPTEALLETVDLDRVEVLRGPQGTLYGRNATGGAINFISKLPSQTYGAGVDFSAGNYKYYKANAYITGPITSTLAFRVSGGVEGRDGYIKNSLGEDQLGFTNKFARGALRFEPSSDFTVDLFAQYSKRDGNPPQAPLERFPLFLYAASAGGPLPGTAFPQDPRPNHVADPNDISNPSSTFLAGLTAEYKVSDALTIRSITSYIDHKNTINADDGTGRLYFFSLIRPSKSYTQELNLLGEVGPVKYLLGANYYHEDYFIGIPFVVPNGIFVDGGAGDFPPGTRLIQNLSEKTNSYAVFGDATVSLTSSFRLIGGVRYTHEKKDAVQTNDAFFVGVPGPIPLSGVAQLPSSFTVNPVIFRGGAQYDLSPTAQVYATYSQGYKSGGQNVGLLNPADPATTRFKPERLNSVEVGLKTSFFNRALIFNIAGFHYDYKDYQVLDVILPSTTFINNGDATVDGLDTEVNYSPSKRFSIHGGVTWLPTAKFKQFALVDQANPFAGPVDLTGKRLPRAARINANAGVFVSVPVNGNFLDSIDFNLDGRYSSNLIYRPFDDSVLEESGNFAIVDFSVGFVKDNLTFRAFVNNVTNKLYIDHSIFCPTCQAHLGSYSPPRFFGGEVSAKF